MRKCASGWLPIQTRKGLLCAFLGSFLQGNICYWLLRQRVLTGMSLILSFGVGLFYSCKMLFSFFLWLLLLKISINSWGENLHKYILRLVPMIQLISWEFCLIMLPMLLIMHIACDLPNQFILALVTSRGIAGMGWFHRNMGCTYPNIKGRVL